MQSKVLIILAILLLSSYCSQGRRGGGGGLSRGGGSRSRSSGSRSGPSSSSKSSYKPKPSHFDKGGLKKYAKMAAGVYLLKKLTPSIRFRPFQSTTFAYRYGTYCHDCVSINGSNPQCENPSGNYSSQLPTCMTSLNKPYCSVEYGVLSTNQTFMRRSCDERRCSSCASDYRVGSSKCYTFQCDLCNWNTCNLGPVEKVFSSDWKGCLSDPSKTSNTFDTVHTCDATVSKPTYILISLVLLAKLLI